MRRERTDFRVHPDYFDLSLLLKALPVFIDTLYISPLVGLQHSESFEHLVRKGLIVILDFQARSCLSTAVLHAAVKLLKTGDELYMLKLEHLKLAGDNE